MLHYMLDTDTVSYVMRAADAKLAGKFKRHENQVCISSITLGELFYGAELSAKRDTNFIEITNIRAVLPVLDFDAEAAEHYGHIRAALKQAGQQIGALDPLIAGHARARGVILVTNNTRHFERVSGLRLENWTAS